MNAVKKGNRVKVHERHLANKKKKKRPAKRRTDKGVIEQKYGPDKGRKHKPKEQTPKHKKLSTPDWLKRRMGLID